MREIHSVKALKDGFMLDGSNQQCYVKDKIYIVTSQPKDGYFSIFDEREIHHMFRIDWPDFELIYD